MNRQIEEEEEIERLRSRERESSGEGLRSHYLENAGRRFLEYDLVSVVSVHSVTSNYI